METPRRVVDVRYVATTTFVAVSVVLLTVGVLQVTIMARTVNVNPLGILVSVLIGVELFGLLGALLAIPAAGVIQVVARDSWDRRSARTKDEPTVGVDEVPHQEATAGTQP